MCFQALGGCLRPTTDSETLSKDPKWVFGMCGVKLAVKKNMYVLILLILVLTSQSTQWRSLLRWGDAVVCLRQSTRAKKHFRYASFFGCLRVIVVDLGAPEDKFVANSGPKTAEKTQLLWKWMPVQTVLLLPFFLDDPVYSKYNNIYSKYNWFNNKAINLRFNKTSNVKTKHIHRFFGGEKLLCENGHGH